MYGLPVLVYWDIKYADEMFGKDLVTEHSLAPSKWTFSD